MSQIGTRWSKLLGVTVGVTACFQGFHACGAEPSKQLVTALSYTPIQPDVVYEKVEREQMSDCSIEEKTRSDGKGFWISGAGGQPLRWFADTNGDNKLDRWSYFNAGVEVYRETDSDFNGKADEFRWLSTEGLRRGVDRDQADGEIDEWTMISAEEVTAEVVAATAKKNTERFARLLISEEEVSSLGLGAEKTELLLQRVADAKQQFAAWAAGQNVVSSRGKWTNFGADKPGIIPAGTDGSTKDVVVYENVVALLQEDSNARQLLVGTMIRVGDAWRLVDLPKAVSEGAVVSGSGIFLPASFMPSGATAGVPAAASGISKAMERLMTELQAVDSKLQAGSGDIELLQADRADVLEKLVSASETAADRSTWVKQFADTVSAAAQTGEYPGGVQRLNSFLKKLPSAKATTDEIAYVVFRTITADHNQQMQAPKAKYEDLQKAYLTSLETFVDKYPSSEDSAEAMIQIALSSEFSGDMKAAASWYAKASRGFADTLAGKKAAGAIRRLDLKGNRFGLQGNTLDGRKFSSASLKGPVVYHCWASWCDGCKAEMRALKELKSKYAKSDLNVVGINFDSTEQDGKAFLQASPFPWVHLYDEGGLDSELAVSYGILTLPMNVVVDGDGRVVATGVHWTELDGVIEGLLK